MPEENHLFHLSAPESAYLTQLASRDKSLARLFRYQERAHDGTTIRASRAEAEQLRDYLTKNLAAVGFDKNYSPTEQGQMLEKLIDRFYLR